MAFNLQVSFSYLSITPAAMPFIPFLLVDAFVELVEAIFKTDGVKFFLSEHVSQDPLEKFFGIQRQRGRVNENPDVQSFCKNTQAIKVIGSICRDSVKGNCRGLNSRKRPLQPLSSKDNEPLEKRRKRSAVPKKKKSTV